MLIAQRYRYLFIVLIFLLAAVSRVWHIDAESLWVDEGFTYWTLRHDDPLGVILRDVHPPVYFYMLRGWTQVGGLSELALRYFSVIPSLLSVAALYQTARELVLLAGRARSPQDRRARLSLIPLLAALLLALADMEKFIAQMARPYTWHVLWVTVSMWMLLRWQRTGKRRWQAVWFMAGVLLLYTHYIGGAALAVQGAYALIFLRGRRRLEALGTLALVGAAFIPWLLAVVSSQTANVGTGYNVPSTLASLWNWRVEWFTQQWALMAGLAALGLAALAGAPFSTGRTPAEKRVFPAQIRQFVVPAAHFAPVFLTAAWLAAPVAAAYALNHYTPILMDYRLTQITPAVALLVAFGLAAFRGWRLAFLTAVIVLYGIAVDDTPRPRPDFRRVGELAAMYAQPGDLALAHITPSGDWQVIYYFDRLMPPGVEVRSLRQWQIEDPSDYPAGLPALLTQYPHVWFMHWSSDRSGFDALAQTGHVQTALMTEDWLGSDLNVYRFDRVPPEEQALAAWPNGLILRDAVVYDAVVYDAVVYPGGLRVDLWWSAPQTPDADYTVSAIVLDESGRLVAQIDSYPFAGARPTTSFQPNEVVYDPRPMQLIAGLEALPPGTYTVAVKLYLWSPQGISDIPTTAGSEYAVVGRIDLPD